ncbi:MAG: hypothetical protein GXP49_18415 [Deltaproteobacteria bacterium]|nr:hypothetical protein [Deltaproteobacteria bacterium]
MKLGTRQDKKKPVNKGSDKRTPVQAGKKNAKRSSSRISFKLRARNVERQLADLARDGYLQMFGSDTARLGRFTLNIELGLEPGRAGWKIFGQPLDTQLRTVLKQVEAKTGAFRHGRVYCYKCMSGDCDHSIPGDPTKVFAGYSSTGKPNWISFGQMLLDRGDHRVDELYAENPSLLTCLLSKDQLHREQLNAFGRQSLDYIVLSQVAAGYFLLPGKGGSREKAALTFQAVQTMGPKKTLMVDLNVIGQTNEHIPITDLLDQRFSRLQQRLVKTRDRLRNLKPSWTGRGNYRRTGPASETRGRVEFAEMVLSELARGIEQLSRQAARRTMHAERRAVKRPVSKALQEARAAGDEKLLWDKKQETIVVLGAKQRIHVFSPEARLVTTLVMESDGVERRRKKGRWITPEAERIETFRNSLGKKNKSQ